MSLDGIMQPFVLVIEWMRTRAFVLGGFSFTFFDWFIWGLFASILIAFINKVLR